MALHLLLPGKKHIQSISKYNSIYMLPLIIRCIFKDGQPLKDIFFKLRRLHTNGVGAIRRKY